MAGLGRELASKGTIGADAMARARGALDRFVAAVRTKEVSRLTTVATAAVRDADNGHELIVHAEALGLDVTLLSGEAEARISGPGVLTGIPDADRSEVHKSDIKSLMSTP